MVRKRIFALLCKHFLEDLRGSRVNSAKWEGKSVYQKSIKIYKNHFQHSGNSIQNWIHLDSIVPCSFKLSCFFLGFVASCCVIFSFICSSSNEIFMFTYSKTQQIREKTIIWTGHCRDDGAIALQRFLLFSRLIVKALWHGLSATSKDGQTGLSTFWPVIISLNQLCRHYLQRCQYCLTKRAKIAKTNKTNDIYAYRQRT